MGKKIIKCFKTGHNAVKTQCYYSLNNKKDMKMTPINLNSADGIVLASNVTGLSIEEIEKMKEEAKIKYEKQQNKEWALQELGYDESWWDKTWKKIDKIALSIPDDLDIKEKTIKMFGWIKSKNGTLYSIPMESDSEYAHAKAIELIMTNPSLYMKIINWD